MTYPKGRKRFVVAGDSPYLALTRDFLISEGWYLLSWDAASDADLALLGVDLDSNTSYMPLAQIEMMALGTEHTKSVVMLSSPYLTIRTPDIDEWGDTVRATWIYAKAAEEAFLNRYPAKTIRCIRPVNVIGPDLNNNFSFLFRYIKQGNDELLTSILDHKDTFIHQEDFLDAFRHLLTADEFGAIDVSGGEMTYRNFLRNAYKFVNGANAEPRLLSEKVRDYKFEADLIKLNRSGWKPKYSVRGALFDVMSK